MWMMILSQGVWDKVVQSMVNTGTYIEPHGKLMTYPIESAVEQM